MNHMIHCFERAEKKYLLTKEKQEELLHRISPYIEEDSYGRYTIGNIYYDTDSYELIRTSLQKPPYKEKLRMRSYGIPKKDDTVFLELKKKYDHTVYKRRISCTLLEAERFFTKGRISGGHDQITHEILYFMNFYQPKPKVYLAYDRTAYQGRYDKGLRITFDQQIRSRTYDLQLDKGDYGKPYFYHQEVLMEIKTAYALSLWLTAILSQMQIYPASFSKYGSIYTRDIAKKETGGNIYAR